MPTMQSRSGVCGTRIMAVAFLALACSGPAEPVVETFRANVTSEPQTFVLNAVEDQRGEWITTHQCGRYEWKIREQFELSPDGSARRDSWSRYLMDGVVQDSGHVQTTGRWENPGGAHLIFTLRHAHGAQYEMPAKIRSSTTLSYHGPMGGVCNGTPDDRVVDYFFTLR